jgi:acyl dehydratase
MSRRDFPLPMVGLVHVENRITWTRPLEYDESLDVRVHAADLRPHRRGRLVDLVTEVTSRDEVVWRGVSTYLARGHGDESAASEGPPDVDGLASRAVVRLRFDEDAGRRYASVSGDVNPIHLHVLSARAFGFDRAIAHGMFSYARVLASLGARIPASGSSTVWFRKAGEAAQHHEAGRVGRRPAGGPRPRQGQRRVPRGDGHPRVGPPATRPDSDVCRFCGVRDGKPGNI